MIATVLALVCAQAPLTAAIGGAGGTGPTGVEAVPVRSDAELSPAAAFESARGLAAEQLRSRWRARAERLSADRRPFWLPEVLVARAVERWIGRQDVEEALRIVDRQDRVREHEFGRSYQTTLWFTEERRAVERGERQLRRELERVRGQTLAIAGGTIGFWAFLALLLGWVDRLSRGYMTGRLLCVGALLGTAMPAVAFLL